MDSCPEPEILKPLSALSYLVNVIFAKIKFFLFFPKPVLWIEIHWIWIRIQGYAINFEEDKKWRKKLISLKKYIFINYKNKISPKEIFSQLCFWIVNVWIRIHKAPEDGSNTDLDPQNCSKLKCGQNFNFWMLGPIQVLDIIFMDPDLAEWCGSWSDLCTKRKKIS